MARIRTLGISLLVPVFLTLHPNAKKSISLSGGCVGLFGRVGANKLLRRENREEEEEEEKRYNDNNDTRRNA